MAKKAKRLPTPRWMSAQTRAAHRLRAGEELTRADQRSLRDRMAALDDELLTLRNALSTARARVDFLEKQGPVAAERQIRLEQAIEKLVFVVDRLTAAPADQDIMTKTRRQ